VACQGAIQVVTILGSGQFHWRGPQDPTRKGPGKIELGVSLEGFAASSVTDVLGRLQAKRPPDSWNSTGTIGPQQARQPPDFLRQWGVFPYLGRGPMGPKA